MLEAALLRYLAVAHFGRGRGEWAASETPAHWKDVVAGVLGSQRAAITAVWDERTELQSARQADDGAAQRLATLLRPLIDHALRVVLLRLYPQAPVPAAGQFASPVDVPAASV
jgi:hypothetical protein